MSVYVLDAGHGGFDPGAVSVNKYKEKVFTLNTVMELGKILKSEGHIVYYTRTNDNYVGLIKRCQISNKVKPDLFVSIHANSSPNRSAHGVESWVCKKGGQAEPIADRITNNLSNALGLTNRGVKEKGFTVLKYTTSPAVLVECAFLSNNDEEWILKNYQWRIAREIANGIKGVNR